MPTALYTTDVQKITDRTAKTTLADTDVFVVANSSGVLAPITKPNAKSTLGIDDAETALTAVKGTGWTDENLVDHEERIAQNADAIALKADSADVAIIENRVDTTELSLATARTDINTLEKTVNTLGSGTKIDTTDIGTVLMPKNAIGRALTKVFGRTATNLVDGADIADEGTVTFASVLNHKYFDSLHGTILTGTGSDMTVTNDTGATANIMVIPLTLIFSTVPSASDCAKFFQAYFANTQNVQGPFRLRARGRNLFDSATATLNSRLLTLGTIASGASNQSVSDFIHIEPNENVTIYHNYGGTSGSYGHVEYDEHKNFIKATPIGLNTTVQTITTTAQTKYLRVTIDPQIGRVNYGPTALPYEPYKSLDQYIADATVIRSIQDVTDTFEWVDGELWHVKKVSTPQAVLSGVAVNVTNYPTAKTGGKWANELTSGGTEVGVVGTDSTTGAGSLRFELATPVYTKATTSGNLQAFAQGDISIEPYYEGSHQTDASSEITLPYEGTLEAVYGYDDNFDEYILASSEYSLTGTTLTITGATENEVFYVKLVRDYEGITPQMTVNALNNDRVTLDTANGKYYAQGFSTTNGVPTLTAVEVV